MSNKAVIDVFTKIFATYNLILIVASFILNPLVLFICLKSKKLRSISTFKLLALGSINDLMTVIAWNQESFTNAFFSLYPYSRNIWYCRIVSVFIQFTSLSFESWMLVSVSLDRLLSMMVKKWTKHYFAASRPFVFVVLLWTCIAAINFNEVFYGGHSSVINGTEIVVCFETPPEIPIDWYHIMSQVFVYFGYIAPLSLLLILNCLIILKATQFSRHQRETASITSSAKKKAQMTRTILVITFLYITISIPGIVITGYLFSSIIVLDEGVMVVNMFNDILFSYPALNFFILFFSNKQFAEEAKRILLPRFLHRNAVSSTHSQPLNRINKNTNIVLPAHNTNNNGTQSSRK